MAKTWGLHISHEYTLLQDLSIGTNFKVISQCQGQVSRSQGFFWGGKNGPCRSVCVFTNTACFPLCLILFVCDRYI